MNSLKYRILQFTLFSFFICLFITAKSQIPVGQWREHLPYNTAIEVTASEDKIYCATEVSLFCYNKMDNSTERLSKTTGLSDISFSAINYNTEHDVLVIGYKNGNIDLIQNHVITNVADIKRKYELQQRSINHIMFIGSYAYLSCSFGISVYDLERYEFVDTYFIGENGRAVNVFETTHDATNLYAATESGIYTIAIDHPNILDFNYWTRFENLPVYDRKFNSIAYFNGKVYANFSSEQNDAERDTIYVYDNNGTWNYFDTKYTYNNRLIANNEYFIIAAAYNISFFDTNLDRQRVIWTLGDLSPRPKDALIDGDGIFWIADNRMGLLRNTGTWSTQVIHPNGPYHQSVSDISVENGNLWAASGGKWKKYGVYSFINEKWNSLNAQNTPQLEKILDFRSVCVNPQNANQVFAGTEGYGIFEFRNNEFYAHYNEKNSTLQNIPNVGQDSGYVRVYSMAMDKNSNLWAANSSVNHPISMKTPANQWYNFEGDDLGTLIGELGELRDMIITDDNTKWIIVEDEGSILAFNEHGTYDDTGDDEYTKFKIKDRNGVTIADFVYSLAQDNEGSIWMGTNKGVVRYYYPAGVFSKENFYAERIKILSIDNDTTVQYLLKNETVTAIAINGANEKWFGTKSTGVFLMSPDATEEILHFTTDNSPLLSNNIICIAIDQESGEVFFGTEYGIVSYRGKATGGKDFFEDVVVFPNPVREDYHGIITIKGLVTNVNVKITDLRGNIVYETTADGGQATWDGRNNHGERVHTGIYFILCTNEDGSKTHVAKLAFVN